MPAESQQLGSDSSPTVGHTSHSLVSPLKVPSPQHPDSSARCLLIFITQVFSTACDSSDGSLGGVGGDSYARKSGREDCPLNHPAGPRPIQDPGPTPKLLHLFNTWRFLPLSRRLTPGPEALWLLPGAPGLELAPKSGPTQSWCSLEFSICGLKTQFLGGGP